LSDQVVDHFARQIVSGRLSAGDYLPSEPELVDHFAVSKAVIRDSLQLLEAHGLVMVQQGKRTVVRSDSDWDVLSRVVQEAFRAEPTQRSISAQTFEARLLVEPLAAGLCAGRANSAQIATLLSLVEKMRDAADNSRDVTEFLSYDWSFHDLIARTVGNVVLRAMLRDLHIQTSWAWADSMVQAGELSLLAEQHAEIAKAIAERMGDQARDAMIAHIEWARAVDVDR
jgi:DNA-binding FadR family transcriptional regulator